MIRRYQKPLAMAAVAAAISITTQALATPYASYVRQTGNTVEFVLNEAASSINILRDGGNPVMFPSPTAGRYTFDMTGFSNYEISVQNNSSSGWTRISDAGNPFTNYERPSGLVVNTNPASPNFGTIYVNNSTDLTTVSGRTTGDGIYSLSADMTGVDLVSGAAIPLANVNDTSLAKLPPGWVVAGSSTSAWRMALDEADNLIVTDWSDFNGGIKWANPDLTDGGPLLNQQAGPTFGVTNGNGDYIHGSIVSKPYVTGSVGNNLTVWAMDEDIESVPFVSNDGNSVWRWDVGNVTDYDGVPQLVINSTNIPPSLDGGLTFLNLNVGVLANAHYEPRFDKWYLSQNRYYGVEAGIAVITADGIDGNTPTLDWSSLDFSIENGLDGWEDLAAVAETTGTNDIFRETGNITISADGTKMFVHRLGVEDPICDIGAGVLDNCDNRYLGQNSNAPGAILVIPLDANGIPDIQVDNNGTPGDPSDDFLANVESITIDANNSYHSRAEITLDAAGNLYVTNNVSELFEVWSPGGNTRAITRSDGTFEVVEITAGPNGDFTGPAGVPDGVWDCLDIDALTAAIAAGSTDLATFDMNQDGVIDVNDVTEELVGWLAVGGSNNVPATDGNPFLVGDANLDGEVDGQDFIEWNNNKFTSNDAWCMGDFNADGEVDGQDFIEWNNNKFTSSDSQSAVPEPMGMVWMALAVLSYLASRGGSSQAG